MDLKAARNALGELQAWRNKVIGMGLVLPDVTDVLKVLDDEERQTQALRDERGKLGQEIEALKEARRHHEIAEREKRGILQELDHNIEAEARRVIKTKAEQRLQEEILSTKKEVGGKVLEARREAERVVASVRSECDKKVSDLREVVTVMEKQRADLQIKVDSLKEEMAGLMRRYQG